MPKEKKTNTSSSEDQGSRNNSDEEYKMKDSALTEEFQIGEHVDVLDEMKKWRNGEVLAIMGTSVKVHFSGYSEQYDDWVDTKSGKIIKQWKPGAKFKLNNRLDVLDECGNWLEARVIELRPNQIQVKFKGYADKFNCWLAFGSKSIAQIGSKSTAFGSGKSRALGSALSLQESHKGSSKKARKKYNADSNASPKTISELRKKHESEEKLLNSLLSAHKLRIVEMGGDGNCLFRAFSYQIYGSEDFHEIVRKASMDYILIEKDFFQDYVADGIIGLTRYVEKKSKDGVWGDDLEIQALSEIYERCVYVYAYSPKDTENSVPKPMKTFHESFLHFGDSSPNHSPIRLAYCGKCHFNSVIEDDEDWLQKKKELALSPGELEKEALRNARLRRTRVKFEEKELDRIINESRKAFEIINWQDDGIELEIALKMSENEIIEKEMLENLTKEAEIKTVEEQLLEEVKKESEKELMFLEYEPQTLVGSQEESKKNKGKMTTEEEILKRVLLESQKEAGIFRNERELGRNQTSEMVKMVEEMGYPREWVEEAVLNVGNSDVNRVIEYLMANFL